MILQLPIHRTSLLPSPSLSNFTLAKWNSFKHKPHHVLHRFQYFVLANSTKSHRKYWIYQIIYKSKSTKFVIKLYTDHNAWWVKHVTFQSILTSLFHPSLFTKSSLQSPLTLSSYITQQFFTSLIFCTTIPTIYTKNIIPKTFCQFMLRLWTRELGSIMRTDTDTFNLFLFPQSMDSHSRAHSQSLIFYRSDSKNWYIAGVANHPVHLLLYPQPIFVTSISN